MPKRDGRALARVIATNAERDAVAVQKMAPDPELADEVVGLHAQQAAEKYLKAVLAHPEVAKRLPVILVHHPPVDSRNRLLQLRDGLTDAASLRDVLATVPRGLVLFGHLHLRVRCRFGPLDVVCASGAALEHPDDSIRAGYNLYELEDGDVVRIEAHVLDSASGSLRRTEIPARPACL